MWEGLPRIHNHIWIWIFFFRFFFLFCWIGKRIYYILPFVIPIRKHKKMCTDELISLDVQIENSKWFDTCSAQWRWKWYFIWMVTCAGCIVFFSFSDKMGITEWPFRCWCGKPISSHFMYLLEKTEKSTRMPCWFIMQFLQFVTICIKWMACTYMSEANGNVGFSSTSSLYFCIPLICTKPLTIYFNLWLGYILIDRVTGHRFTISSLSYCINPNRCYCWRIWLAQRKFFLATSWGLF